MIMSEQFTKCKTKYVLLIPLLLLLFLLTLPIDSAQADIGPKPSMEFEFEYETDVPYNILDGIQLECDKPDCSDAEPLEDLGPQRFTCELNSCFSMAYGYRQYHRLQIRFEDGKTRQSNVFENDSFSMSYRVIVRDNDLMVEKIRGRSNPMGWTLIALLIGGLLAILLSIGFIILMILIMLRAGEDRADFPNSRWVFVLLWIVMGLLLIVASIFSIAIPITLSVELILAFIYTRLRKRSTLTTLTMVAVANTFTLPIFWLGANFMSSGYSVLVIVVAEILIWLVESTILFLAQRKRVPFKEMLLLGFILNFLSFLLGLILPF